MIKGYIFDLDGTLLDTELVWIEVMERLFAAHDISVSHEQVLKIVCGRAARDIYLDTIAISNGKLKDVNAIADEAYSYFEEMKVSFDIRIAGSIELLKRLSLTAPVCIASGSPRNVIEEGIKYMGVEENVSFFLGSEDYSDGKPNPMVFLLAAEKMGLKPEECVVFEDSCPGVTAAKRAGMFCVALQLPDHPKQDISLADLQLDDLSKYSDELL
jgi:HAD superfamily hydrolase (TIGR01509 family)